MSAEQNESYTNGGIERRVHKGTSFKSFFEDSPLSYQSLNSKGEYLDVNPAWEKTFGYTKGEIVGSEFTDFMTDESVENVLQRFPTLKESGEIRDAAFEMIHKDGHAILVTLHGRASYDENGDFLNTNCILIDITEHTRVEEQLYRELNINKELAKLGRTLTAHRLSIKDIAETVLESARLLTRSEHGYVSEIDPITKDNVGHTLTNMLGDACKMSASGERIAFPFGDDGMYHKLWGHSLNTGEPFITNAPQEHPHSFGVPEGHVSITEFLSMPVKYDNEIIGQIALANPAQKYTNDDLDAVQRLADLFALAIHRDRNEEERIYLEAQSYKSSQLASLGELSAGVAHEINNPITGIINYAQMILNKSRAGSSEKDLSERIIKEGDRIASIVRNLLIFSHQKKDKSKCHDIQSLIEVPLSLITEKLNREGTVVDVSIEKGINQITCNEQQIEQVLLNLISNAQYALNKKYLEPAQQKRIEIKAWSCLLEDKPFISIEVKDFGIGITDQDLPKIFDTFYTTKISGEGTGLGLSIVNEIIKDHNGKINIKSEEGEYTRVQIHLPVLDVP